MFVDKKIPYCGSMRVLVSWFYEFELMAALFIIYLNRYSQYLNNIIKKHVVLNKLS